MKIKYKTADFFPINKVKITKESESSVWVNGRIRRKFSDYECYFDTFQEAKDHVMQQAQKRIDEANRSLAHAQYLMRKAELLTDPK